MHNYIFYVGTSALGIALLAYFTVWFLQLYVKRNEYQDEEERTQSEGTEQKVLNNSASFGEPLEAFDLGAPQG